MKKRYLSIILSLIVILTGCSNKDSTSESNENSREKDLSKLPIKVFDKNVVGSKISEKEMKRDIKLYLDTDAVLSKKKEYYENKINENKQLNQSETEKFKKFTYMTKKNAFKISKYISTSNRYDSSLDSVIDGGIDGKLSNKDVEKLQKDNTIVNGKEQEKIEEFLKDKNINTYNFK
ncbi:NDxxF motif lipoprotein [Staphylococcus haemolyticus]|uniref:NDxxF motif lipoprotein n=1 Tax=Staphylococcus TaxID=1279 RepID=UPI002245A9C4|nr:MULTISPECIES: NDxxF motif lipoprotein [Staphylococcus]MCW9136828.1 NDxxF motif lipoprotein [Staphylococcus haemolyticus]MCW9139933.1 NDxxF motif lipoprotein [Staphylococcus sp. SUC_1.2]